jgi:GTP cyclohydrolase IA
MEPVAVSRAAAAADEAAGHPGLEGGRGPAAAETVVPLRPVPRSDRDRAEWAVSELLAALGYPVEGEHRARTPERVVSALSEMLVPAAFLPTTFPNEEGYDELVVARQVPFRSLCEHHLLPFVGHAHIGYLPGTRIVGLSKLARVVEHFAAGLQVQERLTQQVADWLDGQLGARGVGVVLEAEHLCMSLRGVRAMGARTVTSALRGALRTDARSRDEFLALTRRSG